MDIKLILKKHLKWLKDEEGGERANLSGADLYGSDLSGSDLSGADLYGADLSRANLYGANLSRANLSRANLYGADLSRADLSRANLSGADLYGSDLSGSDLSGADLSRANLYGANLSRANLSRANLYGANNFKDLEELFISHTSICPEGIIIGWKKCKNNIIVKLEIPAEAKRSNATGRKCRAEYAKVLEVIGSEVGISQHDGKTKYKAGETIHPDKWDDNRWEECSSGIHFFITRLEAENY
jgi:hypothetical protein